MSFRADLHCHTTCSDGSLSPEELIAHAKEIGLSAVSITDHDTVDAYERAIPAAKKAQIWLGAGVEFSSVDEGLSVHILGYDIDIKNQELKAFCQKHIERRKDRNRRIIEKLAKKGMVIDQDALGSGYTIGRPHIALALVEKGYINSIQDAFNQFIGDGKSCFDPGIPVSTDQTIAMIHQAGGKAFIAHPHVLRNQRHISKLLEKPFDGLECYYSKCTPEQERKWVQLAREKNLIISGGSDFHGAIKPHIPLGCSWVDQMTFEQIFERQRWK
ncbi:MAG: 5'-3' exoribonuclease [Chlamydiae bacterium]|nr:5'-3' exoribonuclease [Chlamydiota bacterium]